MRGTARARLHRALCSPGKMSTLHDGLASDRVACTPQPLQPRRVDTHCGPWAWPKETDPNPLFRVAPAHRTPHQIRSAGKAMRDMRPPLKLAGPRFSYRLGLRRRRHKMDSPNNVAIHVNAPVAKWILVLLFPFNGAETIIRG